MVRFATLWILLTLAWPTVTPGGAGAEETKAAATGETQPETTAPATRSKPLENQLRGYVLRAGGLFRIPDERFLQDYFPQDREDTPSGMYLAASSALLTGYHRYELSRFGSAVQGADMAMKLGLFAGAIGQTAGAWDERSAWYIAGAMAAVGALFGGTVGADDPRWTVRYRWEPER